MRFGSKNIGVDLPPYVVAELSANHVGSLEITKESIWAAKRSGADAIKLQVYSPQTMTIDSDRPEFLLQDGPWAGRTLHSLYSEAAMPNSWIPELFECAERADIDIFASPFDESAVDLLEDCGVFAYKIASFEITDLPLVSYAASTKKPLIISTGMATDGEIQDAVDCARSSGCDDLILLHCVSAYPAPIEDANLSRIKFLRRQFDVVSGLSDHTLGITAAVAAATIGASVIEKHFCLNRQNGGPDSEFSIEPEEMKLLTKSVREAWSGMRKPSDGRRADDSGRSLRRSLYARIDIEVGEQLTEENVAKIRPANGLDPRYYPSVIGNVARKRVSAGTALTADCLVFPIEDGYTRK